MHDLFFVILLGCSERTWIRCPLWANFFVTPQSIFSQLEHILCVFIKIMFISEKNGSETNHCFMDIGFCWTQVLLHYEYPVISISVRNISFCCSYHNHYMHTHFCTHSVQRLVNFKHSFTILVSYCVQCEFFKCLFCCHIGMLKDCTIILKGWTATSRTAEGLCILHCTVRLNVLLSVTYLFSVLNVNFSIAAFFHNAISYV